MRGMYSAQFNGVAVTALQDLLELAVPASAVVIIHRIVLSQSTEVGDAQEEELLVLIRRGVGATSGSGGSTATPAKLETGSAAAGTTVEINNTTRMTGGTVTTLHAETWNVRTVFDHRPTPEERIVLSPSERLTLELPGAPADSVTVDCTIYFEEIGG